MKTTRRRLFGLAAATATLAVPGMARASEPASDETFTLIRSGDATIIKGASGAIVYLRAGSVERAEGTAERLGALLAAVRAHQGDGVSEIRLPSTGSDEGRG